MIKNTAISLIILFFAFSPAEGARMVVQTTVYTGDKEADHNYGNRTAIGTKLGTSVTRQFGNQKISGLNVVAADWSKFPLGTLIRIDGELFVVEDFGSALVRRAPVIDIYKNWSHRKMNRYGRRDRLIEVVQWGDWIKTEKILSLRRKYWHTRKMHDQLRRRMSNPEFIKWHNQYYGNKRKSYHKKSNVWRSRNIGRI